MKRNRSSVKNSETVASPEIHDVFQAPMVCPVIVMITGFFIPGTQLMKHPEDFEQSSQNIKVKTVCFRLPEKGRS